MLKYAVLFTAVFCLAQSQRPWHAGTNNNRLPQVLPQYIDERIAAEQAAQAAQAGQVGQPGQIDQTGQAGQAGQPGQLGQAGQPGQFMPTGAPGQFVPTGQPGQFILTGQPGQFIPTRLPGDIYISSGQPGQFVPTGQPGVFIPAGQPIPLIPVGQPGQVDQGMTSQGPQGTPAVGTNGVPATDETLLGNRIGASDGSAATAGPVANTPLTTIPSDLPVDAHGDIDLVNRIMTWPRDKQPFWFINWQAIQAHRGDANNTAQPVQTQPNSRSFFAG